MAPPLSGILKNAGLPTRSVKQEMSRQNSLPSYDASTSVENPLLELKRLLAERTEEATVSVSSTTANALASIIDAREAQAATDLSGVAGSLTQLNETLASLNATMQAQNKRIQRIESLTEDQVKLGIEQRSHQRAGAITSARAYNAQMVYIANQADGGARFAPLEEVPNHKGVYPSSRRDLPPISSAQLLLSLDLPILKDYLEFYEIVRPQCLYAPTQERTEMLCVRSLSLSTADRLSRYKFVLSKHLGRWRPSSTG
jgi:hypothetical protein